MSSLSPSEAIHPQHQPRFDMTALSDTLLAIAILFAIPVFMLTCGLILLAAGGRAALGHVQRWLLPRRKP